MRILARGCGKHLLRIAKLMEDSPPAQIPTHTEICNEPPTIHEKHFSMQHRAPQQHPHLTNKEENPKC